MIDCGQNSGISKDNAYPQWASFCFYSLEPELNVSNPMQKMKNETWGQPQAKPILGQPVKILNQSGCCYYLPGLLLLTLVQMWRMYPMKD